MFGVHGALLGNAMTWWDHDTGSIWSQPRGEAVVGPRKGQTLELLPMSFTTWGAWVEAHPDTVALDAPGAATGFDLDTAYIVVDFGADTVAYPVTDVEIAVVSDPTDGQRWKVFSRHLDDRVVTLTASDGVIIDLETGTRWDPTRGIGIEGPLRGEILDTLPALTSFPDDYDTFWPDGTVWPDAGEQP